MDTRRKIVPLNEIGARTAGEHWLAVVGLFDPLTAMQTKRVAELAQNNRKLLAVVLAVDGTLLSADARAALIAALREVHLVTIAHDAEWRLVLPQQASIEVVDDLPADQRRSAEFVDFVLRRHHATGDSAR